MRKKVRQTMAVLTAAAMATTAMASGVLAESVTEAVTESAGSGQRTVEVDPEFSLFDENGREVQADRSATGENGVVSSARYEASKIGVEIMKAGGNAVDAAVATAFAVAVSEPFTNGLGGGGFMTLHLADGTNTFVDFREYAPAAATDDMFLNEDGTVNEEAYTYGGLSNAIPGNVKGLLYILDNYGTMSREEVLRPSIELALNGYPVDPLTKWATDYGYKTVEENPVAASIYTNDDLPLELGDVIKNPQMADALELLIEDGDEAFYNGPIGEALIEANNAAGGIMTMEDLQNYNVRELEPVTGTYKGYEIISSPLPSSGGTHLIQLLNILENFDLSDMEPYSVEHMHLQSEIQKIVYQDRAEYMGDPDYVEVPVNGLTSKEYAAELAEKVDMTQAQEFTADDPWKFEGDDTTHLSVADADGNMIGITMSINYYWGSKVFVDDYGFYINNHMNDFDPEPDGPNSVAAGKKPLSSMSPTVVLKEDGSPFMVLGCPGGSTIFTQVEQVISDVIDFGMDMQEAVDMPRILDDTDNVFYYNDQIDQSLVEGMEALGHDTETIGNDVFGYVQAVMYGEDGLLHGAADAWSDAKAVGY